MDSNLTQILNEALLDEYKARALYRKIITEFGPVPPFVNIVEAEGRHVEALLGLFAKYDIPVAEEPEVGAVPATLREACEQAVAAEIENIAMYDRLIAQTDAEDVRRVLSNLQAASRDRHLPAFRRCVERGGGKGRPDA